MLPMALEWIDSISLGEVAVAVGTLLLAGFTYRLAHVTVTLDERVAAREHERHEREVRGVTRLIEGEMIIVESTLELALEEKSWTMIAIVPRSAWDRDGALVAAHLPEDQVHRLIDFFTILDAWTVTLAAAKIETPEAEEFELSEVEENTLTELMAKLGPVVSDLRAFAYPVEPKQESNKGLRRLWPF